MRRLSIGTRLTVWYLAIFAAGQCAFGVGMWLVLRHHLVSIANANLRDQTEDLRSFLETQRENADLAKFREEVAETYSQEHAGEYLAVYTSSCEAVYVSVLLKGSSFSGICGSADRGLKDAHFENQVVRGYPVRFLQSTINTHGIIFVVEMGVPTTEVWETLSTFRNYLLLLAPLVLAISAAGGYWLSRRALAPVDVLTRTARSIGGNNLGSRLEKLYTGDELQRLSDTLNEMLDRIETAFQRISQFTADASHELRTPISLMRTEAEVALRRARNVELYREALEHILREAEKTSTLIEELLVLARMDSASEALTLAPLELKEFLEESVAQWKLLLRVQDYEILFRSDESTVWVMADQGALRRVVNILVDNAVKYTSAPGRISVALETEQENVVLSVSDTGVGIPECEQQKIFQRFYRVDKARSRTLGGAGLGLSIAHWIVERHRGSIKVASQVLGGSRFSIVLPLAPKAVPQVVGGTVAGLR